jgi:exopolyphosphatase/guanosine-5'-triphosphate,3'-diphosphate pyrophosphatase
VIVDLHERRRAQLRKRGGDMRDDTVAALQQRFGVDVPQAERVRSVALALFDAVRPALGERADDDSRRELTWACALHEMGQMVSHHDHHRHSAYLLSYVDAAGFSQSQQRRLGDLVLGQRGGLRKLELQLAQPLFAWQVLCLRLAAIKSHPRGPVDAQALRLAVHGADARLQFTPGWAEQHPRTLYLLQEEASTWARQGSMDLMLPT